MKHDPTTWLEMENCFRRRVKLDRDEFGIESEYLPNPKICLTPKICLVCPEPSMGRGGVESMRKDVRQGYRNFLYSEEDFILHYSAYTFLCNERFQYHITDISKGAMLTRDAGKLREERYERWLPLLQDELRALGHPKIIAVGSTVQDFLTGIGLKFSGTVLHYSWNNSRWIQERYSEIASDVSTEEFNGIENKLQHFAYVTMGHVGYSEEMKKRLLPKLFKRPLPKWKKALLAVYKYDFQRID